MMIDDWIVYNNTAMKQIWLEKYRPRVLDQVYGNQQNMNLLRSLVAQGSVPHLILTGPPGVGKTSSVLCIVRELLGNDYRQATLELNASDQRGIDTVREQIKTFANKKVQLPAGKTKIIVLDEADSLTQGAQHALRMIMSNFSETTRFVLSCNTSSKIIEPIQSRCIILRFHKLTDQDVSNNLQRVLKGEEVSISHDAFQTLLFIANGDMRQAINNLQACYFAAKGGQINKELVLHICDVPSIQELKLILTKAQQGRVGQSLQLMHKIYAQGYSIYDIVGMLYRVLLTLQDAIKKEKFYEMLRCMAELKKRTMEGLTSQIQLGQFIAKCAVL